MIVFLVICIERASDIRIIWNTQRKIQQCLLVFNICSGSVNVALRSGGSTCDSFPYFNIDNTQFKSCIGAIDGVHGGSLDTRWAFVGTPIDCWFLVTFSQLYYVSKAAFMPLPAERTFRDVHIQFDDRDLISGDFVSTGGHILVFIHTE